MNNYNKAEYVVMRLDLLYVILVKDLMVMFVVMNQRTENERKISIYFKVSTFNH